MLGSSCCCDSCNFIETFDKLCAYQCSVSLAGVGPIQHAGSASDVYFDLVRPMLCINDSWFDSQSHESGRTRRLLEAGYPTCAGITAWDESEPVPGNYDLALYQQETFRRDLDARVVFFHQGQNTQIILTLSLVDQRQGGSVPPFPDTKCQVICDMTVRWNPQQRQLSQSESCAFASRQLVGPETGRDQVPFNQGFAYNREASAAYMTSQYENGTWRSALPGGTPNYWNNVNVPLIWWRGRFQPPTLTPYTILGGNLQPIVISFQTDSTVVSAYQWKAGSSGKENFSYSFTGDPVFGNRASCASLKINGTDSSEVWGYKAQQISITPTVTLTAPPT